MSLKNFLEFHFDEYNPGLYSKTSILFIHSFHKYFYMIIIYQILG